MSDSNSALIVRNDAELTVYFTQTAYKLRELALEASALIGRVTNVGEQAEAVSAQKTINELVSTVEKARKLCKEPVLEYGRAIDDACKKFVEELKPEQLRVAKMVGDFQQLEQAKERAAQQARNEELAKIERERAAAIAQAKSHEAVDAIQQHFDREAQLMPSPQMAPRVEGQVVKNDWDIQVTNIWDLARAHPSCVKMEPRLSEIKELLKAGVKVAGVTATPIVKSTVRANGRATQAIEV